MQAGTRAATFVHASASTLSGVVNPHGTGTNPTNWDVVTLPPDLNPAGQLVTVLFNFSATSQPFGVAQAEISFGAFQFEVDNSPSFVYSLVNATAQFFAFPGAVLQSSLKAVYAADTVDNAAYALSFAYEAYGPIVVTATDAAGATASLPPCPFTVAAAGA